MFLFSGNQVSFVIWVEGWEGEGNVGLVCNLGTIVRENKAKHTKQTAEAMIYIKGQNFCCKLIRRAKKVGEIEVGFAFAGQGGSRRCSAVLAT
jgi:hypothetical protein